MSLEVSKIVEGKVVGITNFGAFVELEGGKNGLVHISEVAVDYVKDIKDHLKMGDKVKVKIISIDANGKISLSIKKAQLDEQKKSHQMAPKQQSRAIRPPASVDWSANTKPRTETTFEDMMSRFKNDSDDRFQDLKRNTESKRGGGYSRRG